MTDISTSLAKFIVRVAGGGGGGGGGFEVSANCPF